jgi:hypothetical protein
MARSRRIGEKMNKVFAANQCHISKRYPVSPLEALEE